jgi:hypothetical protein
VKKYLNLKDEAHLGLSHWSPLFPETEAGSPCNSIVTIIYSTNKTGHS